MGVKSTVTLTRAEAEQRYVDAWLERKKRKARMKAALLSNRELENVLEEWNDDAARACHGGTGFENYVVRDAT